MSSLLGSFRIGPNEASSLVQMRMAVNGPMRKAGRDGVKREQGFRLCGFDNVLCLAFRPLTRVCQRHESMGCSCSRWTRSSED